MRKWMLTTLALISLPAVAVAEPFGDLAQIEVLPGWRNASGDHIAAFRITLEPGWKTYWRAPGDAGIPPHLTFSEASNVAHVTPHWPVPEVFTQNGFRSIGYYDSVVVPLTFSGSDASAPMRISGSLNIGVCEEICIPVSLDFDALLPPAGERDPAIAAALISQPLSASEANVGTVTCTIDPISDGLRVTTTMDIAATGASEVVVIEAGHPDIWVSEADISRTGDVLRATVDMVNSQGTAFALDRSAVRITELGGGQAVDIQGCTAG